MNGQEKKLLDIAYDIRERNNRGAPIYEGDAGDLLRAAFALPERPEEAQR